MKIVNGINQSRNIVNNINKQVDKPEGSFKSILNNEIDKNSGLQFSKHANQRILNRDIYISKEQMTRVEKGVSLAKEKGIKDTLVLVDNIALVININSNVVVTAINKNDNKIFTNIDGAIVV
ncbi:MAG: hypothetical protein LBV08_01145 [Clostridiales bacterium]|jgi:flagellar operon protein|nr:hypothetical protein [Clostridiales bacterium]